MGEAAQHGGICEAENQQIGPFFSIIIPAYNVEKYIGDCLDSILKQMFRDFEIILINDGSADNTLDLMNLYAAQSSKIRVIHFDKNQGAAAARNRGIREAKGKYILFVDADDTIAQGVLLKIHDSIAHENIDNLKLIVFGIVEEYYNRNNKRIKTKEIIPSPVVTDNKRLIREAVVELEQLTLYGYLWNKVYNVAYLKSLNLKIPDMNILEDIYFNINYCQDIDSIIVMDMALYTYKKRYGTVTGRRIPDYYDIHRERMRLLTAQYKSWDLLTDRNRQYLALAYTRYLFSSIQRINRKEMPIDNKSTGDWLEQVFTQDEVYYELIENADIGSKSIIAIMFRALKRKRIFLILIIGKVIEFTETYLRPLYLRLK